MELNYREPSKTPVRSTSNELSPPLVQVLYVDGNEDDLIFTQLSCKHCGAPFNFRLARSVEEAIWILQAGFKSKSDLPDLILLEVLTEGQKGLEVLEFVAAQPRLQNIPVVVFTRASDPTLLARANNLGAKCVLEKQADLKVAKHLIAFASNIGLCR